MPSRVCSTEQGNASRAASVSRKSIKIWKSHQIVLVAALPEIILTVVLEVAFRTPGLFMSYVTQKH